MYLWLTALCCLGRPTFGGNWLQVTHARLNLGGRVLAKKIGKKARWTAAAPAFLQKEIRFDAACRKRQK